MQHPLLQSDRATEHTYHYRELVKVPFLIKTNHLWASPMLNKTNHTETALKYPHIYEM